MFPSIVIPYFNVLLELDIYPTLVDRLIPYPFRNIYWTESDTAIFDFNRQTMIFKSGFILILRIFLVFFSWMFKMSPFSNWMNRSWRRTEIRRPVKTLMVINRQYLYSPSLSILAMIDRKSSQSSAPVVVLYPDKLIYSLIKSSWLT